MKLFYFLLCMGLAIPFNATATGFKILPQAVTSTSGTAVGDVSALQVLDQSGKTDTVGKYITLTTPRVVYNGYLSYTLPPNTQASSLKLKVNFKGAAAGKPTWFWGVFNWGTQTFDVIGNNAGVKRNQWQSFVFDIPNPTAYIDGNGEIRISLNSKNAASDAKIDYEAVLVNLPTVNHCDVFPPDHALNTPIDTLPVHTRSDAWVSSIGTSRTFHMDFGSGLYNGGSIGIPFNVVAGSQTKKYPFNFYYPDESDPGPYPIPKKYKREFGSDHHILVIDTDSCKLYEIFDAAFQKGWKGGSGAIWDLSSNALRTEGWTSADAAGLPIFAGLVRYEEVASGAINHAIRFTVPHSNSYIWPARHLTSGQANTLTDIPPFGARFRLKASFDISGFMPQQQVILTAMKKYGIINADNGSGWFVSGAPDERWDNELLHSLGTGIKGSDFEAVDMSCMMVDVNSGQADLGQCP